MSDERDELRADLERERFARRTIDRALLEAIAARDDLQARIDAYEGHLEEWEEVDRLLDASSLGTPEAKAIRERTPPLLAGVLVRAAQAISRAEEAEAERDRLMEELRWTENTLDNVRMGMAETSAERDRLREMWEEQRAIVKRLHESTLGQLTAERDRLQAVVDAAREMRRLIRGDHVIDEHDCAMAVDAVVDAVDRLDGDDT